MKDGRDGKAGMEEGVDMGRGESGGDRRRAKRLEGKEGRGGNLISRRDDGVSPDSTGFDSVSLLVSTEDRDDEKIRNSKVTLVAFSWIVFCDYTALIVYIYKQTRQKKKRKKRKRKVVIKPQAFVALVSPLRGETDICT